MIWLDSLFKLINTIVEKAPLTTGEKRKRARYKAEKKFKELSKKANDWIRRNPPGS